MNKTKLDLELLKRNSVGGENQTEYNTMKVTAEETSFPNMCVGEKERIHPHSDEISILNATIVINEGETRMSHR